MIEGGVNYTLSIDRCAWVSSIRWWWGGRQVLLKLRCLRRRVCCLSLSPWWSGWKAAGCLNTVRSHLRFRVGLDMYELTTGEYTVVFKLYILSCQLPLILPTKIMPPFNLGSNHCPTFREQCVTVTNVNDLCCQRNKFVYNGEREIIDVIGRRLSRCISANFVVTFK